MLLREPEVAPWLEGRRPVTIEACAGSVQADVDHARRKVTESCARWSSEGVSGRS
jgi:hypothetical protein